MQISHAINQKYDKKSTLRARCTLAYGKVLKEKNVWYISEYERPCSYALVGTLIKLLMRMLPH